MSRSARSVIKKAALAYMAAHNGAAPPGPNALLPYFATPQEGADFTELLEARKLADGVGP